MNNNSLAKNMLCATVILAFVTTLPTLALACGSGFSACGSACYDSKQYVCIDGQLCPSAAPAKCGNACYNPAVYHCNNGVLANGPASPTTSPVPTSTATPVPTTTATASPTATSSPSSGRNFYIVNKCQQTVWVGALNNPNYALPANGGFQLISGQTSKITVANNWGGRFWGRTYCNFNSNGQGSCATGDCGNKLQCNGAGGAPPASLAEFTLSGWGGNDFYDVSLVDGYNLPMQIEPVAGTYTKTSSSDPYNCGAPSCISDLNTSCPAELQKKNASGTVVACMSACEAFNTDEYCCRGAYGTPATCPPTAYSLTFKAACPTAYSYAYDDSTSTYQCKGADYTITFCPYN